jgi:response regulator RpfG family c-di-GMP phosphodiesterase
LAEYSASLGEHLKLSEDEVIALRRVGVVHDIGKIAIPDSIILKPSGLSPEEWKLMREHPVVGERICAPLKSFRSVLPIIRHHHEKFDGSGYPDGLAGEAIPITARVLQMTANIPIIIVSIVDQTQVGFALRAADYLLKPIRKPILLETIRKHVPYQDNDAAAILLVDDDPGTLALLEETLRGAGYETQSVRSGKRALEVLSSKLISAVLLDLLMPGMDGFEVIRHVRQEASLKGLPILVMTGKNLTAEEAAVLGHETQALLQKNGSWQQQLIAEVNRVTEGRKLANSAGHS